ncbi:hypothetical protein Tco_0380473 [Tanacetum coccineum]
MVGFGSSSGISGHALNELVDLSEVRSLVGNNSLECLRESQEMKNNKLKALAELIAQTEDAICWKEGHMDIMELSK